ncbi:hypothetical protein JCM11251_005920 [Rhodosporidiobolus azoricus]
MPQRTLNIERFRPSFSGDELAGLKQFIRSSKLPRATYASKQEKYGITHEWIDRALDRWQNGFDWKEHEERINSVENYHATVEDEGHDYKLHLIYHESKDPDAIPLLLLHGWPGSAFEFIPVVHLLRSSTNPSFHLIVPMLPGYGWSQPPPVDRDFNMNDCARILDKLMAALGHGEGYAVQGGDIGAGLARLLAARYDACRCAHFNYIPAPREVPPPELPRRQGLSEREEHDLRRGEEWKNTGKAYGALQATRPGTIGIVVGSSPVALLAWLGEKLRDWVDVPFPLDEVLSICTIWWLRESFPASIWPYPELLDTGISYIHSLPANNLTHKSMGFSAYPKELSVMPEAWVKETGNLVFYRQHDKGGHFPSVGVPEEFAQDIKDFLAVAWQ